MAVVSSKLTRTTRPWRPFSPPAVTAIRSPAASAASAPAPRPLERLDLARSGAARVRHARAALAARETPPPSEPAALTSVPDPELDEGAVNPWLADQISKLAASREHLAKTK